MTFKAKLMLSCAVMAAMGLSSEALAQGAATATQGAPPVSEGGSSPGGAPSADTGTGGVIGEVVVTANKRAENLQNVAASVSAVSQATLDRQGVKEFADLTRVNPEIRVIPGTFTNITLRGIRTSNFGPTVDQPNAVHIDGVYVSRAQALNGLFFDIERVEVLAGPQGTLYGRNSAGGTINIITAKPGREFGGRASVEYGNYNQLTLNGAINIPLTDRLSMRAAYWRYRHDGYNDNGTDDANQESARLSFLWRPSDDNSLLVTLDRQYRRGKGVGSGKIRNVLKNPSIVTGACVSTTPAPAPYACTVPAGTPGSVVVPIPTGGEDSRAIRAIYGDQDVNQFDDVGGGIMGQYDHDFGWANLTAQAAYRDTTGDLHTGTTMGFSADPRLITTGVLRPAALGGTILKSRWNTQEIRLTSPSNQTLTWVGGLFRFHEHTADPRRGNYSFAATYPNTSAATLGQIVYVTPLTINSNLSNTLNDTDAYAAFGQATYTLGGLHLTGGLRYNDEKKHGAGFSVQNGVVNPRTVFDLSEHWKAWTYKLNASYDLTPRNMIYVDHSTGFKSGGFAFGSTPAYQPERIKAYEIGTKNRFLGNRLQVNAAAWHYDYTNIVQTVLEFYFDTTLGRPNSFLNTTNGKKAKVDGQSITIDAALTDNDLLNFNATHIKSQFTDFNTVAIQQFGLSSGFFPGATAATFDYAGTPFPNVPTWAFNFSYDHIVHVGEGELDLQVAAHYTGKRLAANNSISANDPNAFNWVMTGGQTTYDASARFQPGAGRWSVTAYVRNFTNEDVILSRGYVTNNTQFLPVSDPRVTFAWQTETYAPPRTFGVILSANF